MRKEWAVNIGLIIACFLVLGWLQHRQHGDERATRYAFCVQVEHVRTYARQSATRSLKSLPTISYYQHHPRERAKAVRQIEYQRDFFSPPLDCKRFADKLTN